MKDNKLNDAFTVMLKELQTILTVAYVFAVGIGMLFSYYKFAKFDINIFDYADLFDFLIAPFSDITILIATLTALLLSYISFRLELLAHERFPAAYSIFAMRLDRKPWYNSYRSLMYLVLSLLLLNLAADKYGDYIREEVMKGPSVMVVYISGETVKGKMIGKTSEIIFIFTEQTLLAIPFNAVVKKIELPSPGKISTEEEPITAS